MSYHAVECKTCCAPLILGKRAEVLYELNSRAVPCPGCQSNHRYTAEEVFQFEEGEDDVPPFVS